MGFNKKVAKKLQLGKMMNMQETRLDHQSIKTEISRDFVDLFTPKIGDAEDSPVIISLWISDRASPWKKLGVTWS